MRSTGSPFTSGATSSGLAYFFRFFFFKAYIWYSNVTGHNIYIYEGAFEHLSYFSKGKCVRQQPLALSRRTRPPLSRLVALLARGNTRNTPDTSPFPRWEWVGFLLPFFLSFCPFYPSPRCPPAWGGEAGAGPMWGRLSSLSLVGCWLGESRISCGSPHTDYRLLPYASR
jgi:hypothetical protein